MKETFRLGVGAVVVGEDGRVLALERSDVPGSWQLPQGGVEAGEELLGAVLREVREEAGIAGDCLELLAEHPVFLGYELPPALRSAKTGRGQCHRWFLFRLTGPAQIRTAAGGEFGRHRWVALDRLAGEAVAFRQPVYRELVRFFGPQLATSGSGTV